MAKKNLQKKKKQAAPKKKNAFIPVFVLVLILIATWWVYKPATEYGFTNWDDPGYVYENGLLSLEKNRTSEIFKKDAFVMGNYHPVTVWSLALTYDRAGAVDDIKDPTSGSAYRKANIMLHLGVTAACFLFVYLLFGSWVAAAAAGIIMGLHPMHVESVAWVAARKDPLYGLYFFLSLISYLMYVRKKGPVPIMLFLSIAFFLLSMLSKAMAAPLPVVLLLLDWWEGRKFNTKLILEKIPFFAIALYLGYMAIGAQESSDALNYTSYTFIEKAVFAGSSFLMYIIKFFVPTDLSAFYPYPDLEKGMPSAYYIRTLITIVLLGLVIFLGRKKKILWLGFGMYILMLALVLQFLTVGSAVMADRYTYIPFLGLALILGWMMEKIVSNQSLAKYKPMVFIVLIVAAGSWALASNKQVKTWKDTPTLFTRVIETQPGSVVAWNNRGKYYGFRLQDYNRALSDLNIAVQVDPDFPNAYVNRGNTFGMLGDLDKAIKDYERAISLKDDYFDAYLNLAITWSMKKEFEKALPNYTKAIELKPENHQLYYNRGYTYFEMGMMDESMADYNTCLRIDPTFARALYYRGVWYANNGENEKAMKDAKSALRYGFSQAQNLINQINARQ